MQKDGCVETSHMEQYVEDIQRNTQVQQSNDEFSIFEIEEIVIKYNSTSTTTCFRKPAYAKMGMNFMFAISTCLIIILIILLIFILVRW